MQKNIEKYNDRSYNGFKGKIGKSIDNGNRENIETGENVSRRRKRRKNREKEKKGMPMIVFVVVVFCVCLGVRTASLKKQSKELAERKASVEKQLKEEQQRTKELEELEKYMQTKKYMEEVAKEKLGLVYPDEILIEPDSE